MTINSGAVTLTQSYAPYGDTISSAGSGVSVYQFTGEMRDANGLTYLRARYMDSSTGRFINRDTWAGDYNKPLSLNRWNYGYANPILYTDPSGYSPNVNCSFIYLPDLKALCYEANEKDEDTNTIDAREKFLRRLSYYSSAYGVLGGGDGYFWAGKMLRTFLDGNVQQFNVNLSGNASFGRDAGIVRTTKIKKPPISIKSDEPASITPLLYELLQKHIQPVLTSCSSFYSKFDDYSVDSTWDGIGHSPRPYNRGWWGAFGHVEVDAIYSSISSKKFQNGYLIQTQVTYNIDDNYGWFEGKKTPFGPPVASEEIMIPHEWELSLVNAGKAYMFDFNVKWHETLYIFVSKDFSYFGVAGESNIPLTE